MFVATSVIFPPIATTGERLTSGRLPSGDRNVSASHTRATASPSSMEPVSLRTVEGPSRIYGRATTDGMAAVGSTSPLVIDLFSRTQGWLTLGQRACSGSDTFRPRRAPTPLSHSSDDRVVRPGSSSSRPRQTSSRRARNRWRRDPAVAGGDSRCRTDVERVVLRHRVLSSRTDGAFAACGFVCVSARSSELEPVVVEIWSTTPPCGRAFRRFASASASGRSRCDRG